MRDSRAWREWGESSPAWALQFFLSDAQEDEIEALDQLVGLDRELEQLLDGIEDRDIRVTITIERRGDE